MEYLNEGNKTERKLLVRRKKLRAHQHGRNDDIDRGATFTKGECLSTLYSPSSAFASRESRREGRKSEEGRDIKGTRKREEKERKREGARE